MPENETPGLTSPAQHETGNRLTSYLTTAGRVAVATSRAHGALRLLSYLRGPDEHQVAVLRSARRRLTDALVAVEELLHELAA